MAIEALPSALHPVSDEITEPAVHNWLAESFHNLRGQRSSLARVTIDMVRRPRGFCIAWSDGSLPGVNPLTYFAKAVGLTSPLVLAAKHFSAIEARNEASVVFVLHHFEPYLQFVALGLLCHLFLKMQVHARPWYQTLGVALFVGGGPAALADVLSAGAGVWLNLITSSVEGSTLRVAELATAAGVLAVNIAFIAVLVDTLSGVHRVRWWRPLVAVLLAQLVWSGAKIALLVGVLG